MLNHRVQDYDKFAHAGGQRLLPTFAASAQLQMEGFKHSIAAYRDQRTHVKYIPDLTATARYAALSLPGAAFANERCNPHQSN